MTYEVDRLKALAERLNAPCIDQLTAEYVRTSSRPGPLVVIAGGAGRGKSGLLAAMTGLDAPEGGQCFAVFGAPWESAAYGLLPRWCRFRRRDESELGPVVVVEAPSIDTSEGRRRAIELAGGADLIVLATQANQAGTEFELEFVQELPGYADLVVVLTKVDQLLADDLEEVRQDLVNTLAANGLHPVAVLTSSTISRETTAVQAFAPWWQEVGVSVACDARVEADQRRLRGWVAAMRRHADDALAQVEGELQPLRAAVAASDEAREASELCARFGEALKPLPDEALRRLAEVAPGLQAVVRAAVTRCSEDPSIGDHDLATRAAEAFHQEAGNWLLDALKQVRGRMATPVRRLGDCLTELTGLLNRITPLPEEPGRPEGQETTQKLGDLPRGPGEEIATVDLSPADVAQRKLAVTTAMASAGLATVLLVAGGPVPFVLGTAAVAVQRLLASQQMAEANRRKLRALVMETCNLQLGRLERQVHDDFLQAWRAYAAQIRSRYEPLRRALLGEIAAHPGWRDPKLRPRFQELSKRHAELSDIRSQIEVVEPASAAVDADV